MSSLVRLLVGEAGPARRRILLLGTDASALAVALRSQGHEVVEPRSDECEARLGAIARSAPATFDAVVSVGFVERQRWDRWALQRIHQVLKQGGTLMLAVPDLFSIRSLLDPRYVATKLAKVTRLGPGGSGRPGTGGARETTRSYAARRLRATLEHLGYEPLQWSGMGLAPSRGLAGAPVWPPTHHLVLARKRGAPADAQAAAPDPAAEMRRFEAENRAFVALRDRWRRDHALPNDAPRALEPEQFAGAPVLALAPHPDDEIIGCGGTLLRLVRAGAKVTVLQATDGSASAALEDAQPELQRTIRLGEARAVAEAAGFEPSIFWNEDNRAFRAREDLVARLRETLREIGPALIFTPFVADIHPDHLTLNRILAAALAELPERGMTVVGYEVWSLAPANLWCDVSSVMGDVERLLLLYETAMKVDDFIHMCSTRNRHHALTLRGAPGHAEAFFAAEVPRFRALMDRLPRGPKAPSSP